MYSRLLDTAGADIGLGTLGVDINTNDYGSCSRVFWIVFLSNKLLNILYGENWKNECMPQYYNHVNEKKIREKIKIRKHEMEEERINK